MGISIEKPEATQEDRRKKLKELREFHQPTLDKLGVSNAVFIPKMAYKPHGEKETCITFFLSEISKGEDVYVEFCSKELVPEDPLRRLYKWRFNPHYEEEYNKTEPHAQTGHVRYIVPIEELIVVKVNEPVEEKSEQRSEEFVLPDPDDGDLPLDQITMRDLAALLLRKPVSRRKWLNDIIEKR